MVCYKVWIQVERIPERGEACNVSEPMELGVFDRLRQAEGFAMRLHREYWGECSGPECKRFKRGE